MERSFRGEAGKAVGAVKCLLSAQEASVFLSWTKCLFLLSPCSFQILGGLVQFTLAEHLGKAFLKSAKYLLVFA